MTGPLGRRRPTGSLVAAAALTLGLAVTATGSSAATTPRTVGPEAPGPSIHSSDGVVGPLAEPMPRARLQRVRIANERSYRVVRGVTYRQWDQTDARGTVRAYLLRADLRTKGLSLQYAAPDQVAARDELSDLAAGPKVIGAVNGDFFDISDTGAPLGVGIQRVHDPARAGAGLDEVVLPSRPRQARRR